MVVANIEHGNLGDGLSKRSRAEPIAVVVEEEAVEGEEHVGRDGSGDLLLLVLLVDPFDKLGLLGEWVAVDLGEEKGQLWRSVVELGRRTWSPL
jgi:hypothetical protein